MTLRGSASYQLCFSKLTFTAVSMDGSWYDGQMFVGIKEAVFEPSSALRHASELHDILKLE